MVILLVVPSLHHFRWSWWKCFRPLLGLACSGSEKMVLDGSFADHNRDWVRENASLLHHWKTFRNSVKLLTSILTKAFLLMFSKRTLEGFKENVSWLKLEYRKQQSQENPIDVSGLQSEDLQAVCWSSTSPCRKISYYQNFPVRKSTGGVYSTTEIALHQLPQLMCWYVHEIYSIFCFSLSGSKWPSQLLGFFFLDKL